MYLLVWCVTGKISRDGHC